MEVIDQQWNIFAEPLIDSSTSEYAFSSLKPLGNNLIGQIFGQQSPIEFLSTDSAKYLNLNKSYIQVGFQLQASATVGTTYIAGSPYPAGTPIALEFDAFHRLFNRVELLYGSSVLESTSVYHDRTCLVRDLLEIDGSYINNNRSGGLTDMLILDDSGKEQIVSVSATAGSPQWCFSHWCILSLPLHQCCFYCLCHSTTRD